jgi:alanine racemase
MQNGIETYKNRPTRAEISVQRLHNNLYIARAIVGADISIMAMVKGNAYGHGILAASEEFLKAGADYLGVAYLEEALFLRKSGITAPILVCGAIQIDQIKDFIENNIDITSSSLEKSRAISRAAIQLNKNANVHLKIDTGMERIGVHWYNAEKFIEDTMSMPCLNITGIFSHFAKAESDPAFTMEQICRFKKAISNLKKNNSLPRYIHIANSAGILNYKDSLFNMVRPGIMLYGYNPGGLNKDMNDYKAALKPAMTLKSKVSYFKVCEANVGISYNHTYFTKSRTRIITLPLGYGDGYNRLLSNRGRVVIRGKSYPVTGAICMDQIIVDIGADGIAYNGDDVLLFGEHDGCAIPLEELCEKIGTITYEFLCGISSRVPRIYLG